MFTLQADILTHAQDIVSIATGFARTDVRVFIQNTSTAAVHYAKVMGDGHTVCGWRFAAARKRGAGPPYRVAPSLKDLPGSMLCEKCLPTERALAMNVVEVDLSGDE